jgi:hypothetical protein
MGDLDNIVATEAGVEYLVYQCANCHEVFSHGYDRAGSNVRTQFMDGYTYEVLEEDFDGGYEEEPLELDFDDPREWRSPFAGWSPYTTHYDRPKILGPSVSPREANRRRVTARLDDIASKKQTITGHTTFKIQETNLELEKKK